MAWKHKLASLAVLALAVLFNGFFMFTKHDGFLSPIIPFAGDPYDAIGSIAMIMGNLLALLCLFRAFLLSQPQPPLPLRVVFLARAQLAVAVSVLVVLGADIVAMLRHMPGWTGKPATGELVVLLAGMAAASLAVLLLVLGTVRNIPFASKRHGEKRAAIAVLVCSVALAIYPESIIRSAPLHFLTIVLGFVLFFVPVSLVTTAVLPYDVIEQRFESSTLRFFSSSWMQWAAIAILGLATGAGALLGEMFGEGGSGGAGRIPLSRVLIVFTVFLGSGVSGLLLAFAFLRKPLGLFRKVLN